jgi:hypothetical protein
MTKRKKPTAKEVKTAVAKYDSLHAAALSAHNVAVQSENLRLYDRADAATERARRFVASMPREARDFINARDR